MDQSCIRVLVIDDDAEDHIIIRQLLARVTPSKFELDWVDNFEAGKRELEERNHDVYLVDYVMGAESGLDLLTYAREIELKKPIIVLTNHDNYDLDRQAIGMGAADYLPKRELTHTLLDRTIRHALERAQLMEKLYHQATHDPLTDLYNRKYIMEHLQNTVSGSKRHGHPLSFCLCDVDYFKQINDTYGHSTGDLVLQRVSTILSDALRKEDVAGRYGGDEFCIIFPHISPHDARTCTERIRKQLQHETFKSHSGVPFSVTVTFGISYLRATNPSTKSLIDAADQALYEAKLKGRNQTVIQKV